jgi:hypothetical protein
MRRLALVGSLLLGLTGCSLTIDPNSVPPPVVPGGCIPLCAGRTCGVSDGCTGTCEVSNSTCTPPGATTHTIIGRLTPGAGSATATGGHRIGQGTLTWGQQRAAATAGHSISQGTLSP